MKMEFKIFDTLDDLNIFIGEEGYFFISAVSIETVTEKREVKIPKYMNNGKPMFVNKEVIKFWYYDKR